MDLNNVGYLDDGVLGGNRELSLLSRALNVKAHNSERCYLRRLSLTGQALHIVEILYVYLYLCGAQLFLVICPDCIFPCWYLNPTHAPYLVVNHEP